MNNGKNTPVVAEGLATTALRKLCDQLDGEKRRMRHTPGTGQNHSYMLCEDVDAYVEEARKALAHPSRCEECVGTGKVGPDENPLEMDCEVCNGSGQVAAHPVAGSPAQIVKNIGGAAPAAPDPFPTPLETFLDNVTEWTRELDVLVHGVPTGAGLAALVETLRSRQSVQILKLEDGMRVNFRAPDGRRTTMFLDVVVDDFARTGRTASELARVMRAAIEAYPVAGTENLHSTGGES